MKERMGNWSMFFKVVGWICVIGGIAALVFTMGLSAIAIIVGLCCWFTCAVLEWMDGLTDQLIESRELQQRQLTALLRIEEELVNARKQSERITTQTGTSGRRRPAREEGNAEPAHNQEQPVQFDAQHIADVYRMAQRMDQ